MNTAQEKYNIYVKFYNEHDPDYIFYTVYNTLTVMLILIAD